VTEVCSVGKEEGNQLEGGMGAIKREEEWSGAAFVGKVDEGGPGGGPILG